MMPPKPLPNSSTRRGDGAAAADAPAREAGPAPAAEVRQRWRLVVQRRADAPPSTARELLTAWEGGFAASGLPIAGLEAAAGRPRLVFGAPLPASMPAERELVDIFLTQRLAVADVRDAVTAALPPGHALLELYDVWLGAPALPGQVAAADYRLRVAAADGLSLDLVSLQLACDRLLEATALPRTREKGGRAVAYDLRPLLAAASAIAVEADGRATLRIRTRFDPERGVGRPEEVVAAIGEAAARPLQLMETVRERLLLAGDA